MSKESGEKHDKNSSTSERLLRFGRNINILGAVAIGGAALVIPGPNALLGSWAAINVIQAGGFELLRGWAAKNENKKRSV